MTQAGKEGDEVRSTMTAIGERVWKWLAGRPQGDNVGVRG
jgi:hypothetical protein